MWRMRASAFTFLAFVCTLHCGSGRQSYYELLGVTEFADAEDIKKAYRKLSLQYHPDKFKGDPAEAQEKMVKLNDAFKCLKDPAQRRMYEYYEHDYESMVLYEAELKKNNIEDLYMYDSSVHILWSQNIDLKFKPANILNHTWILNLYNPNDATCKKQAEDFKTFGRIAEKSGLMRAAAINCALQQGLCHRYWQQIGQARIPLILAFPSLQPDENQATDFEEFNIERMGWPTSRELERWAMKIAANEVIQVDGDFLEKNITRNPRASSATVNGTADERIAIWIVWFYHSAHCSKVNECDRTAPGFRRLSTELKGIARMAAINCKVHLRACRGHTNGASSIKVFVHRGSKHFVEAVALDLQGYEKHQDTAALAGAAQILKLLVKPAVELWYPPHPHRPEISSSSGSSSSGGASAEGVDLSKADLSKMKVSQLKSIIASRGEKCVGCADKSDFIAKVREIADREAAGGPRSDGEL